MTDNLPTIAAARLPYHPILEKDFDIDRASWRALIDSIYPSAKTVEGVMLAIAYCKARKLDIFKKPVHVVPIWSSQLGRDVESVWPGIGELRITAMRTGDYAGSLPADWGPDMTAPFQGKGPVDVTFPEWCQITLKRKVRGTIVEFPGPRVYWLETYGRQGKTDAPNSMWTKRPRGQLEKCAEAAALRKAFPEEIGEGMTVDEVSDDMRDITPDVAKAPATAAPGVANMVRTSTLPTENGPYKPVPGKPPATAPSAELRQEAAEAMASLTAASSQLMAGVIDTGPSAAPESAPEANKPVFVWARKSYTSPGAARSAATKAIGACGTLHDLGALNEDVSSLAEALIAEGKDEFGAEVLARAQGRADLLASDDPVEIEIEDRATGELMSWDDQAGLPLDDRGPILAALSADLSGCATLLEVRRLADSVRPFMDATPLREQLFDLFETRKSEIRDVAKAVMEGAPESARVP